MLISRPAAALYCLGSRAGPPEVRFPRGHATKGEKAAALEAAEMARVSSFPISKIHVVSQFFTSIIVIIATIVIIHHGHLRCHLHLLWMSESVSVRQQCQYQYQ